MQISFQSKEIQIKFDQKWLIENDKSRDFIWFRFEFEKKKYFQIQTI